jgi:predicted nucleic acid-binding protein
MTDAKCYVDTSAFIALLDRSDSFHALFRRLSSTPPPLATSALAVAEGHGCFLRRYDRRRAAEFLAFFDAPPDLTICGFDAAELAKTGRVAKKFSGQSLTLADAHGLAIMRERRLGLQGVPLVT